MEMGKTYSRSAAFEDRTGNPLMSLASAAGMEEHAGSSVNGSAPKGLHRAVKVKEEELISDDVKSTQAYNHGKVGLPFRETTCSSQHFFTGRKSPSSLWKGFASFR